MRVLVVEDEALLLTVLSEFLRELGHQPVVAGSAEAALQIVERDPPELILLDVMLPGMNGLDFMRTPSVRQSGVPVVVMSGIATESQAREALALGAMDFLAKPMPLDRLADLLEMLAPLAPAPDELKPKKPDRRPARRVRLTLDVRIAQGLKTWAGTCLELSASGMKARSDEPLGRGMTVRLSFALPDSPVPLDVPALVVRVDGDGAAFWFLDVPEAATARIESLVARRNAGPPPRAT